MFVGSEVRRQPHSFSWSRILVQRIVQIRRQSGIIGGTLRV